ncbi:thiazole biosynthesis protein [Candidatus Aerophobetes bacterium]|nr:thiazole biosynthesis protein [Candidatus Aerophobetes bacterium]
MKLDDVIISEAIVESFFKDFRQNLRTEVVIAGAGPAGLTAGYYLAKEGVKVTVFEKSLRLGGGMPGGGIMFNKIVVQEPARHILEEMQIRYSSYKEGYYVADSLEAISSLTLNALRKGVKIFNLIAVEDVMVKDNKVEGVVINWEATRIAKLHVDPITVGCKAVIDATGHGCEVVKKLEERENIKLNTPTGKIIGEGPMWAERGEEAILECTREVYPGLYVCGMAANAVFGAPRMGPVFGGMLLSGKRVAQIIKDKVR